MKNTITEIKNILEGINSRLDDTEEWISELKDRWKSPKLNTKKFFFNEDSLRDLWDNIKHTNIYITRVPEREKRKGQKTYLKQ